MERDPFAQLKRLEGKWSRLFGAPLWYLSVAPDLAAFMAEIGMMPQGERDRCKGELYDFFEDGLVAGTIALGDGMKDADAERKPVIDTVVIHHTSNPPGMRPSRLSAIELIRLYVPYFANPAHGSDAHWKGQPIASGHARGGTQVFWPYHWMIRSDGTAEQLLYDYEIGWHAGDWDINCRSVGIAFDSDLEWAEPSARELQAVADLIATRYPEVPASRIFGHCEVTSKTQCPSRLFLPGPSGPGWKQKMLQLVESGEMAA